MNFFRCFLLSAILLPCFSASGQYFKYRKEVFNWPAAWPRTIPVEDQFSGADAVILEDSCIVYLAGHAVPAYSYINRSANYYYVDQSGYNMQPLVQRHVRVKLLTTAGARKYSQLILPEPLDPTGDIAAVRMSDRDSVRWPKSDPECIRHVAARILKEDGRITAGILDEKMQVEVKMVDGVNEKLYSWQFRVINAEPGDELEWDYFYDKGYSLDPSNRIFFNAAIPKQNFHLTIRYPRESLFILTGHNGAQPYDSVMDAVSASHNSEYYYSAKNLPGGIGDAGGRPHLQLPYVSYYHHNLDYGQAIGKSGVMDKPMPYSWEFAMMSWGDFEPDNLKLRLIRGDQTTRVLNDFVKEEKAKAPDTSLTSVFSSIQHTLAGFSYVDDLWEQVAGTGELEHLGYYIFHKTLRASSRLRLYKEVMMRLNMEYFMGPLHDKRVCEMDINRYENLNTEKPVFAVLRGGRIFYYYPKSYRFGYEANELPFYYEGIPLALVTQFAPNNMRKAHFPDFTTLFVTTPGSTADDNFRRTYGEVKLVPASGTAEFHARVKLSGQFSTLTRGYYQFGSRDTVVNPAYYDVLSDLAGGKVNWTVDKANLEFPYETTVSSSFTSEDVIEKDSANQYSIDLDGWFNQVIEEEFTAKNRTLDFYPDFLGQDIHVFKIACDQKMEIMPGGIQSLDVDNSFARFTFSVKQQEDGNIYLESHYRIKRDVVPAAQAKDVQEVYAAIRELKNGRLLVRVF